LTQKLNKKGGMADKERLQRWTVVHPEPELGEHPEVNKPRAFPQQRDGVGADGRTTGSCWGSKARLGKAKGNWQVRLFFRGGGVGGGSIHKRKTHMEDPTINPRDLCHEGARVKEHLHDNSAEENKGKPKGIRRTQGKFSFKKE